MITTHPDPWICCIPLSNEQRLEEYRQRLNACEEFDEDSHNRRIINGLKFKESLVRRRENAA